MNEQKEGKIIQPEDIPQQPKKEEVKEEVKEEPKKEEVKEEVKEEPKKEEVREDAEEKDIEKKIKDLQKKKKSLKKDQDEKWWSKFFGKKKLRKPNMVAVIYLKNNGNAELMELEPKNEMFSINGKTYHERNDCTYTVTKDRIPLAIIPEWGLVPVGTKRWDDQDMMEKFSQLEEHVLKGIRHAEIVRRDGQEKTPATTKQIILWIVVALVAGAILINYI